MNKYKLLRIIAGKFRGRKIFFSDQNIKLRPTLDRVRETVFNWLAPYIVNASCLDLFAGTGIFGFEALSRGAKSVVALEYDHFTYQQILANKIKLQLTDQKFKIINQDTIKFLSNILNSKYKFDIIFLDPPYKTKENLLLTSLDLLNNNNFFKIGSKIYFESDQNEQMFSKKLQLLNLKLNKVSKAGRVYFYLAEYSI